MQTQTFRPVWLALLYCVYMIYCTNKLSILPKMDNKAACNFLKRNLAELKLYINNAICLTLVE